MPVCMLYVLCLLWEGGEVIPLKTMEVLSDNSIEDSEALMAS